MKRKLLLCGLMLTSIAYGQTTYETSLTAQLPLDGQDAMVFSLYPTTNYGNYSDIAMSAWTYNGVPGTMRSVIRFPALAVLASNHQRCQYLNSVLTYRPIKILSATLTMNAYGSGSTNWGSNYYPGTPLPNTNPAYIKRILSGKNNAANSWVENTITWNTAQQMTFEPQANWATIPVTSDRYNGNFAVDVTDMVQRTIDEMVGGTYSTTGSPFGLIQFPDPLANNGFMLQLQNETYYRSQFYGSSDGLTHQNTPRLNITYQNNDYSCDAAFAYFHKSETDPFFVQFSPLAGPMIISPPGLYEWYIDKPLNTTAAPDATTWYLFYTFTPGTHTAWLKRYSQPGVECARSGLITINVDANGSWTQTPERPADGVAGLAENIHPDDPLSAAARIREFSASPNPTTTDWTISLSVSQATTADATLYDLSGRKITSVTKQFTPGTNQFITPAKDLPAGIYFMELKGGTLNHREKLIKH